PRRGGRVARCAAVAAGRREPHRVRDGRQRRPATVLRFGACAPSHSRPRGTRGRCHRRRDRDARRCARCDRVQRLRGARLLRHRQCERVDVDPGGAAPAAVARRGGRRGLRLARVQPAAHVGAVRCCAARGGRGGVRYAAIPEPATMSETDQHDDRPANAWPPLPLAQWQDTYDTLHMWTQIVGKVRLAQTPLVNHWWNVPLYVDARGLTTSAVPYEGRAFELRFDFESHVLVLETSDDDVRSLPLAPCTVADFYDAFMRMLGDAGIHVAIWPMPVEVPDPIRFDQ